MSPLLDIVSSRLDTLVVARTPKAATGNSVRAARRSAELTQAELATRVGVSRQTIVAIESGGYAPSVYLALELGRELGHTVEDLFTTAHAGTGRTS